MCRELKSKRLIRIRTRSFRVFSVALTMTITKPEQLHVIFLPFPAKGHSLPMLHFAKQLHSAGVMVTFVNSYNHLSSQHFRDLDSTIQIESLGEPEGEECVATARHADELASDAELLIKNIYTRAPLACIVSDMFLGWTQASICLHSFIENWKEKRRQQ